MSNDAIKALEALREAWAKLGSSDVIAANMAIASLRAEQPAPKVEVPPMPHVFGLPEIAGMELCLASTVRALHAAAVALAERCKKSEALRVELREKYDEARAQLAEAQAALAKEPQTPLQLAAAACRAVGMLEGHSDQIAESVRILAVRMKDYADTYIPLEQHQAALRERGRQERE